ncbi:Predicted ATP-dependent protease [Alteribacillus persepolensis]|uniref:endopeptidase La n=1 Tax=Alteribacillus persepolensis TaxID=568899 RepID=A0A1G8BGB2_9BACI|nr:AAA family ATPase [Alteribacillus persepolensis]SDH32282.1 Predicted ATP-dependent protease [Alteribacillus persepolensis]
MRKDLMVSADNLAERCDPNLFGFETTDEVKHDNRGIIGQHRAVKAMDFGLNVQNDRHHLFLTGPSGTGKTTYAKRKTKEIAKKQSTPQDWVYTYNFQQPDRPKAMPLPPGLGVQFAQDMEELMQDIEDEIERVLNGKPFERRKMEMAQQHEDEMKAKWEALEQKAKEQEFTIERTQQGVVAIPLNEDGEAHSDESFDQLPEDRREEVMKKSKELTQNVNEVLRLQQTAKRKLRKRLRKAEEQLVHQSIHGFISGMKDDYQEFSCIQEFLNELEHDVIKHWKQLLPKKESDEDQSKTFAGTIDMKQRYKVNAFVDHSSTKGAPVIYEIHPSYANLFGKVDYKSTFGSFVTDNYMMTAGSLHTTNGGYLILNAADVLAHPYSWKALKQVLKTGELRMENSYEDNEVFTKSVVKPEAIPLRLKVIMIGTPSLYQLLYRTDEDFRKLFKVKVDFDTDMERNKEHKLDYAAFVASFCNKECLRHLTKEALAKVIDYSTRLANNRKKLSTRFDEITEILIEANYWAEKEEEAYIHDHHVSEALRERFFRSNRSEQRLYEAIDDGTIMISTSGQAVGQLNALVVSRTGEYAFGHPTRVTARTYVGRKGIVNIDRESLLTGSIHTKGLHILSGYLQAEFAQNYPLPLAASITFEQSYNMVDGDSASSTELYALLSSLGKIPLRQDIAVTGSVNQFGEIQSIGGVNEKIEGFFYVCRKKGLTGTQGVIIPKQNVKHLMLRNEVIEAVEAGLFHIWAVSTIKDGIEILTGLPAGTKDEQGNYSKESVYAIVQARILNMLYTLSQQKGFDYQAVEEEKGVMQTDGDFAPWFHGRTEV